MDQLKERFLKAYANIPIQLRGQVILILEQKLKSVGVEMKTPISWNVAYLEVDQNSNLSETILEQLSQLDLI